MDAMRNRWRGFAMFWDVTRGQWALRARVRVGFWILLRGEWSAHKEVRVKLP